MALTYHFSVEFWYRAAGEHDLPVRAGWQMRTSANSIVDVQQDIVNLRAQGYLVQHVEMMTVCPTCEGAGRIGVAPKGTRKVKIASLPDWRKTWHDCVTCKGAGGLARTVLPLEAVYPLIASTWQDPAHQPIAENN